MAQGKRLVRRDGATGRWLVHVPERAGASFVRATPAQPLSTTATPPVFETRLRALEELRAEVRGLVGKATSR